VPSRGAVYVQNNVVLNVIVRNRYFTELADTEYYKCGDKLQLVQTRYLDSVECLEIKNYQV
jgi:hypothetical protein